MFKVFEDADYVCGVLEDSDYELFIHAYSKCYLDKNENDFDDVENLVLKQEAIIKGDLSFLDDIWDASDVTHFVLLEKGKQPYEADNVLGIAKFSFMSEQELDGATVYSGIHVLSSARNRGFASALYRCGVYYAEAYTDCKATLAEIRNDNDASIRAAISAGFVQLNLTEKNADSHSSIYFKPINHEPLP